jgi:dolichyl-phosphate beta-glucosyltransferase
MDADHSVSIENFETFKKEIEKGAEIVIASIELPGSTIHDDNFKYRRVLGKWSKGLIRSAATPGIYDTQRGFKLFTAKATEELFSALKTTRWGFDIELLRRAQKKGYKIKEIPVDWNNSKASSVGILSYPRTFLELIKIVICV